MGASEIGAISAGFYMLEAREFLYDLVEAITGARLTVTYCRLGGVTNDLPPDIRERVAAAFASVRGVVADCERLLSRNRIFVDRMRGVGILSRADAISWGMTGPLLRATGVAYDVRKADPYLVYDRLDFEIPTGTMGDNYDRFNVRLAEIDQSMKIVEQALAQMPEGAGHGDGSTLRAAAEARSLRLDRGPDEPLQARDRGAEGTRRRGVRRDGGRQRRARVLPRVRRERAPVPRARATAVLLRDGRPRPDADRRDDRRRDHDVRADQHDRGRV
jgi:hypothetical protein